MEPRSDPHHGRCNEGNLLNDPLVGVEVDNGLGVLDEDTNRLVTERSWLGHEISDISLCSSRDGSWTQENYQASLQVHTPHSQIQHSTLNTIVKLLLNDFYFRPLISISASGVQVWDT